MWGSSKSCFGCFHVYSCYEVSILCKLLFIIYMHPERSRKGLYTNDLIFGEILKMSLCWSGFIYGRDYNEFEVKIGMSNAFYGDQ